LTVAAHCANHFKPLPLIPGIRRSLPIVAEAAFGQGENDYFSFYCNCNKLRNLPNSIED
jgi:hypothetical protein